MLGQQVAVNPLDPLYAEMQLKSWTGEGNTAAETITVIGDLVYFKKTAEWATPVIIDNWVPITVAATSAINRIEGEATITQGLSATWIKPSSISAQWAVPVLASEWSNNPIQATWVQSVIQGSWTMSEVDGEDWIDEQLTESWIKS
jgi:hypothetical protein